jgi:hypothetical protein
MCGFRFLVWRLLLENEFLIMKMPNMLVNLIYDTIKSKNRQRKGFA